MDDAVTLVLTYAEIPYDVVYDAEVMEGKLIEYDWLHLHHEDFTGQYGKFYRAYRNAAWYQEEQAKQEASAASLGFAKVSEMKRAVALEMRNFVLGGGFLFTMCSGTDSFDIALAAQETDICEPMFDGDPADPLAQQVGFRAGLCLLELPAGSGPPWSTNSATSMPRRNTARPRRSRISSVFFDFSAKWDVIPTPVDPKPRTGHPRLHGPDDGVPQGIRPAGRDHSGERAGIGSVKYLHGTLGEGQWSYYGGHDPEDYRHQNDPPTDLNLHPNSPGYRLILNNILFPASREKKRKT